MKLSIPFYQQTMDFSCGPACIAMVLKYFDYVSEMNRDLEIELWRETSTIEIAGCGRFGISAPLALRGLHPHIISSAKDMGLMEGASSVLELDSRVLDLFHTSQQRLCAQNETTYETRIPTLNDINQALSNERIPLCLVSTIIFGDDEDIPHWIVITGSEGNLLTVHNPLDEKSNNHRDIHIDDLFYTGRDFKEKTIVTVGLSSIPNAKIVEEPELPPWPSDYQYHLEKD